MKLLLDEHFSPTIAEQLRARGHDVVAVAELSQLRQQPDEVVLASAITEKRSIIHHRERRRLPATAPRRGRAMGGAD